MLLIFLVCNMYTRSNGAVSMQNSQDLELKFVNGCSEKRFNGKQYKHSDGTAVSGPILWGEGHDIGG